MEEKRLEEKRIYTGKILDLYADRIILPNGKKSFRECINHIGASAALPILNQEEVILVKQYRYCVKESLFEIPAGIIEPNEAPEQTIKRELEEEIGYTSDSFESILTYYSSPGFTNEKLYLFTAKRLRKKFGKQDEDEFTEPVVVKIQDAIKMIKRGEIKDGKTIIAILYYLGNF